MRQRKSPEALAREREQLYALLTLLGWTHTGRAASFASVPGSLPWSTDCNAHQRWRFSTGPGPFQAIQELDHEVLTLEVHVRRATLHIRPPLGITDSRTIKEFKLPVSDMMHFIAKRGVGPFWEVRYGRAVVP